MKLRYASKLAGSFASSCIAFGLTSPHANATQVALVLKGRLVVQSCDGGRARAASPSVKKRWQAQSSLLNAKSPGGQYRVESVFPPGGFWLERGFRVVKTSNGAVVLSLESMRALSGGGQLIFDGWIDATHCAVIGHGHASDTESYDHCIVNVVSGQRIKFNGWLAPNGKSAIVPNVEGLASDAIERDPQADGHDIYHYGNLKWYTAAVPANLTAYKFASARRNKLSSHSQPFLALKAWFNGFDYDSDPVKHAPLVEFSKDGLWALAHGGDRDNRGNYYRVEYVISMNNGQVHALIGTNAKLL